MIKKIFNFIGGCIPRERRQPGARGALLLTLYVFNIYPMTCFGLDVEVENIFDFDVPVGIIETGVVQAAIGQTDTNYWADVIESVPLSWSAYLSEQDIFGVTNTPYASGYNTNMIRWSIGGDESVGGFLNFNTFGSQYSTGALYHASAPQRDVALLYKDTTIPWLSVPNLQDMDAILNSSGHFDAPPDETPLSSADPVLSGLQPDSSFWVTQLTPEVLASFDGGLIDSSVRSIDEGGILGFLPRAWPDIKSKLVEIFSSHRLAVRTFVGPVCVLVYVFLCFRWWLRRIFYVFEIFSGVGSGRGQPWSNDSEMTV